MSLHKFAEQVAANGRGDDSLLVHMTPDEVQRLQSFAQANGRSLTINPETGLPEAGILSDLFKAVAPIALGAFLGPGAFGIAGMGLSAGMAGAVTGGLTTLATGSLSRGLMAGLGAYGGAGLAEGLGTAGANAMTTAGAANYADTLASQGLTAGTAEYGEAASKIALDAQKQALAKPFAERMSAGLGAVSASPEAALGFAKQNMMPLAAAAAPIMAGQMVPTTTKMPAETNPAYIRQKLYDPYTQTYKSLTPVKASEWGGRNFSDAYTNPQTGQMATLDVRKPTGMAGGGITSLAGGGQPSLGEWLDKAGISREAREQGSPELHTAINAYNVVGSSLDPYRQTDTRDWASVMAAENPIDALIQQNLPLYGGAGHVELTDTGGRLVSGAGDNLTSDLSRYEEFGIKLNPTQIKNTLGSMQTDTPMNRARYNRINNLYEEAVRQAQEGAKTLAGGGIVALAQGGVPGYANGMLVGDQDVFDYFKGLDQAKLASGALDAQIAKDMQTYNVGAGDIARITGTQAQQGDFEKRFVQAINPTTLNSADFLAKTADVGLTDQALANAMQGAGMSQAAQYAATHALDDTAGIATAPKAAQDFYNAYGYKAGDAPGDKGGIAGLYTNIDYAADRLQDQINAGKLTVQQAQNLSLAEMERLGINLADVKAATGSDFANLFKPKTVVPPVVKPPVVLPDPFVSVVPGDTKLPKATTYDNGAYGNYGSGNVTGTDYLGRTVSIATPGDIITNPDNTRTVTPNIPGRPYGGFTGMDQVKSAYTAGGGSLGYTAKAPRTIEEFNQLYNKQTGDSLAAYDYLMGKGGGKYPVQSQAAATGINRPYWGEGMRYKPKFLSYDKEGELVTSTTNPNAPKSGVAASGKLQAKAINVLDNQGNTIEAVLGEDGYYHSTSGGKYDVTGAEVAASGGMMGYAMGGGLGSLGAYSDGGRLLKGPGDGVSDSIPATIGAKGQPARLADGEFVIPARIVSELGNGSTDAGAKKLYAMMDRVQKARGKTTGKNKVAANSRADKHLPA